MIKFFRRIRQKLLTENRFTRYSIYAIGEIILVVIGILIALWVNNLNEDRKLAQIENLYLNALKTEFSNNLGALKHVMDNNKSNYENALRLANILASDSTVLSEQEFNNLLFNSIIAEVEYRPSPGTLNEILNSGKLDIISDNQLRAQLSSWGGVLQRIRFQEEEHAILRMKLMDLIYTRGNFRNGYLASGVTDSDLQPRKAVVANLQFRDSQEFDNLLTTFYLTGKFLNEYYYSDIKDYIEETLSLLTAGETR